MKEIQYEEEVQIGQGCHLGQTGSSVLCPALTVLRKKCCG